jgi:hypothetical protein
MKIVSLNQQSVIYIEFVESDMERYPSVCVKVQVKDRGFSGYNKSIWIVLDDFNKFIEQLKELDQSRRGTAELHSMSPGELSITIAPVDRAGHLMLKYCLSRTTIDGPFHEWISLSVTGRFDLDSTFFSNTVKQVEKFIKDIK